MKYQTQKVIFGMKETKDFIVQHSRNCVLMGHKRLLIFYNTKHPNENIIGFGVDVCTVCFNVSVRIRMGG